MLHVPYVDIAGQHQPLKADLLSAIGQIIDSGQFILGEQVQLFEQRMTELCGVNYAVGVNSGTDALIIALRALNIGPGDEVITAPNSFVASTSCIAIVGAKPVFVDVREDYNIDPEKIEAAITPHTKAILPVHLTGRPADMSAIMTIATKYGIPVIEDSAQAILAEFQDKPVGSWGTIGCFSLHPLKTLNACGDGGLLTTNDESLYKQFLLLRNLGLETRDDCVVWSSNSRLDTVQAAMLLVKLNYLHDWTKKRQANAKFYQTHLADIEEVVVPIDKPDEKAVYHTFVIQAEQRDELRTYLTKHNIGSAIHYPVPIHLQTVAKELGYGMGSFPITEIQAKKILSLPIYADLTEKQLQNVVETIKDFYKG